MQHIFTNKKILICVSGSIAVYKMLECISQLSKYGADVKVIMSAESSKFVTALSFEALSHNIVLTEENQTWIQGDFGVNHITYAKWADIVLVAPATANTIAKIIYGIADSVFLGALLATNAPKVLAPAMNTAMLYAPQTQRNIAMLKQMDYEIIPSRQSILACGDEGDGALAEIDEIIFTLGRVLSVKSRFWENREVIISGGGSKESIDCVRYISNHSSGKQASALALACFILGAKVKFVSSVFPDKLPLDIECIKVTDVQSFENAINKALQTDSKEKKPVLLMAGALADYAPVPQKGKLKKEYIGEYLELKCHKTRDILASISPNLVYKVGFKAEVEEKYAFKNAQKMLDEKKCDMVCLNVINEDNPFGGEDNSIKIITHVGTKEISGSKFEVSLGIITHLESILYKQGRENI